MKIRTARSQDAAVIASQNMLLAKETERIALKPSTILAGVKAVLADATKGFYLVAEENNAIVGQLMITMEWSDWRDKPIWWVQSVYVQRKWRKKGVFTKLLYTVERRAREQGVAFLRLYVYEKNLPALRSYEKRGWTLAPYKLYRFSL